MSNEAGVLYASRPIIEVNGQVQGQLSESLLSLTITESVTEMARCQARFANAGSTDGEAVFLFFESGLLAVGNELKVTFSGDGGTAQLFQGRITAVEGLYPKNSPPEIQVYAEDGLEALRHIRRSRTFHAAHDREVIEAIANEYGLQTVFNVASTIPPQDIIAQLDQTDLAFLLGRARRMGVDLWMDGNTLHVQERAFAEASRDLSWGSNLLSFRVRADLAEQVTRLGVTGWDVDEKEALDAIADDSLIPTQVYGSETGSTLIDGAYGGRTERLVRQVPLTVQEAQALAEAQFLARAYRFVIGDGEATGMPALRAGRTVSLQGLGSWFNGVYHLVAVRHTFDGELGYRTTFTVERPALNELPSSSYGRTRRRRKAPSRVRKKPPRGGYQKPGTGEEAKPKPSKRREPKRGKQKGPDLAETKIRTVLDD